MMKNLLVSVLQDECVLNYLQHEDVVQEYFGVPDGVSPSEHVIKIANESGKVLPLLSIHHWK